MFSAKEIKPFPLTKLITYEEYINKYKNRHSKISKFFGDLNYDSYQKYSKEMEILIKEKSMNHGLKMNVNSLFEGLSYFDFKENIKAVDTLIIYQWTKNNFPVFLNRLLRNFNEFNDTVAYFTARLMYGLNKYGMENDMYSKENREFYGGLIMPYSSILQYLRAKGKIINLPFFIDTSENINFAEKYARRKVSNKIYQSALQFSVLFLKIILFLLW